MPAAKPTTSGTPAPRQSNEALVSRVIAFAGAGILLIGVSLLLVLAAQSGYFGPLARTIAGGVLAAALVGTGVWLQRKQPSNVGAIALAATGIAAAYLDIGAITGLYQWWPRPVGLAVGAVVALAGLVLARRWNSQLLAVIVTVGVVALIPGVNPDGPTGMAFLLIFTLVTAPFHWGRAWVGVLIARLVPTALASAAIAATLSLDAPELPLLMTAVIVLIILSLGGPIMAYSVEAGERASSHLDGVNAALLPLLVTPAMLLIVRFEGWPSTVAMLALGALLLAAAFVPYLPSPVRAAAGAMGTLAVILGINHVIAEEWLDTTLLAVALGSLLMAWLLRDRQSFWRGAVVGVLGGFLFLIDALVPFWAGFESYDRPHVLVINAVLLVAVMAAALGGLRVDGGRVSPNLLWAFITLATFAVSTIIVAVGSMLAGDLGFRGAHALVTVLLFVFAGWLLLRGLRPGSVGFQRAGYVVAAIAGAKLFLYDLAALDGFARIFAFIVGGLVLLVLGVLYARAIEKAKVDAFASPPAAQPLPPTAPSPESWPGEPR